MKGPSSTPSDVPYEDLKKERDAFIQQFFRKGAQLTEELLKENERLREHIDGSGAARTCKLLRTTSPATPRSAICSARSRQLEKEKRDLLSRSSASQAATDQYSDALLRGRGELAHLANLYVATSSSTRRAACGRCSAS
jgi:hypothetical protein